MLTKAMFKPVLICQRFYRYAITDNRKRFRRPRYWTGKRDKPWSTDRRKAMLWAEDFTAVMDAVQDITRTEYKNLPQTTYTMTVKVNVLAEPGVTKEELQEYIERAVALHVDYHMQGMGPTDPNTGEPRALLLFNLETELHPDKTA